MDRLDNTHCCWLERAFSYIVLGLWIRHQRSSLQRCPTSKFRVRYPTLKVSEYKTQFKVPHYPISCLPFLTSTLCFYHFPSHFILVINCVHTIFMICAMLRKKSTSITCKTLSGGWSSTAVVVLSGLIHFTHQQYSSVSKAVGEQTVSP